MKKDNFMTEKYGEKESKRNTSAMAAIYTRLVPREPRTNKAFVSRVGRVMANRCQESWRTIMSRSIAWERWSADLN
jgi:hypothetical protein